MAVTIKKAGGDSSSAEQDSNPSAPFRMKSGVEVRPDKFEVYGRLRLNRADMVQLEGVTPAQMTQILRRHAVIDAYNRGRAQCKSALRQKIISLALSGSERMLALANEEFADSGEVNDVQGDPRGAANVHSWDQRFFEKADSIRDKYLGKEAK